MADLPKPDGDDLAALIAGRGWSWSEKAIYRHLYEHRDEDGGLTIADLWELVQPEREERLAQGKKAGQARHFDRRLRKLDDVFDVARAGGGEQTRYKLVAVLANPKVTETISKEDRAWALRHQRCAQCGRTPNEHGVRLHVDHKIPREWGGTNDRENLQALCSECNEGKKNLYASYDEFADEIRAAIAYDDVYVRIGELLKAFADADKWAPDEVIEMVAEARGPQRYWEKRMRELRHLGWTFVPHLKTVDGRRRTEWELTHSEPWPAEGPGRAVRQQTRKKP